MGAPGALLLTPIRPVIAARLRRWLRLGARDPAPSREPLEDPLLAAGRELRQRREARGLSLRQLAMETRISTPVLEALERGWRERLPEPTYLRTMLPLIERHLELRHGSLEVLLPSVAAGTTERRRPSRLARFTPGSIEVYSSWQGTLLYGLLTLALVYGLNLEQRRLAAEGLLVLRPIPPLPAGEQQQPARPDASLLESLPELRPLDQPPLRQALRALGQEAVPAPAPPTTSAGLLVLRLQEPTRVSLSSGQGARSELLGARGELVLPLVSGFQLQLTPAPGAGGDTVQWNGKPLSPLPGPPAGRYAAPAGAATPRP